MGSRGGRRSQIYPVKAIPEGPCPCCCVGYRPCYAPHPFLLMVRVAQGAASQVVPPFGGGALYACPCPCCLRGLLALLCSPSVITDGQGCARCCESSRATFWWRGAACLSFVFVACVGYRPCYAPHRLLLMVRAAQGLRVKSCHLLMVGRCMLVLVLVHCV